MEPPITEEEDLNEPLQEEPVAAFSLPETGTERNMTMTNKASDVSVSKPNKLAGKGVVNVAPIGTDVPPADEALGAEFKNLGYTSEAGWSENVNRETTEIKEMGGDVVLRPTTSYTETYSFGLLETNADTLKFVYGEDNVTVADDVITVVRTSADLPHCVVVIDTLLSDGRIKRVALADAQLTELGEITHTASDAIVYQCTVTAFPDDDGSASTVTYAKPVAP